MLSSTLGLLSRARSLRASASSASANRPASSRARRSAHRVALALALLATALPACASHQLNKELSIPDVVAERAPGVVRIEVPGGYGSGFVVDERGVIATSYHVIAGAEAAEVVIDDTHRLPVVRVLASDELHDLALVQVQMGPQERLRSLPLGDSRGVRPGEPVLTIGSPFGMLDHTVSDGLVSSVRGEDEIKLLQISAPISEGSSGGPLLNRNGEVIGMASMIVSGGQNVNFAIPVEYLEPMLKRRGGESMTSFGKRTAEPEEPTLPETDALVVSVPDDLLNACEEPSQRVIQAAIDDAVRVATPLCNEESYEACYRIYEGAIVGLASGMDIEGCLRTREVLSEATARGKSIQDPADRAIWLRDTLRAVGRALQSAERQTEVDTSPVGVEPEIGFGEPVQRGR